jgi:hypothetical protein
MMFCDIVFCLLSSVFCVELLIVSRLNATLGNRGDGDIGANSDRPSHQNTHTKRQSRKFLPKAWRIETHEKSSQRFSSSVLELFNIEGQIDRIQ